MFEFLSKFESHDNKLLELTQFASTNLSIYFNFVLHGVGVRSHVVAVVCTNYIYPRWWY